MKDNDKRIVQKRWGGFLVSYLNEQTDWLSVFKEFLSATKSERSAWKCLQSINKTGKFLRTTWQVDITTGRKESFVIFKMDCNLRRWNPERVLREWSLRGKDLQERIETAHANGFSFPMRIFLVAERRRWGFLRERYIIAEFIEKKSDTVFYGNEREICSLIMRSHDFGICWGGDPNSGNIIVDKCGDFRGIDMAFKRATWLERGKDLDFFFQEKMLSGAMPLCVRVVRFQAALKSLLRNKISMNTTSGKKDA